MTQKYQVKVSMNQAAIVKTGLVLKQGDFGMQVEIEVLDFDVSNTTPQIVFRKLQGAVEATTITVSNNKYTYTFRGTELDIPGRVICDLKLKNSTTQRISSASFSFEVVADTLDGLTEEASSYSDSIEQILTKVPTAEDAPAGYTDFNQFKTMGIYTILAASTYANDPIGSGKKRTLLVLAKADGTCNGQVIFDRDTGEMYFRSLVQGVTWGNWTSITKNEINAVKDDLDYTEETMQIASQRTEWRNGSCNNPSNTTGISFKQILPNKYAESVTILINKALATEHKYRYQLTTYTVDSGKPENNTANRVTVEDTIEIADNTCMYELKDGSAGFALALYELDENEERVPLRIETFDTDKVYIARQFNSIVTDLKNALLVSDVLGNETVDLNDYLTEGRVQFKSTVTLNNAPENWISSQASELQIIGVHNNNAFLQVLTNFRSGNQYTRYYSIPDQSFTEWRQSYAGKIAELETTDFNNLTDVGSYYFPQPTYDNCSNVPTQNVLSACILEVSVSFNGVILQIATLTVAHMQFMRIRDTGQTWRAWSTINGSVIYGNGNYDLNTFKSEGVYAFRASATRTNEPNYDTIGPYILVVKDINAGRATHQTFISCRDGLQFERYYSDTYNWNAWTPIISSAMINITHTETDFNNCIMPGTFYISAYEFGLMSNKPPIPTSSIAILKVSSIYGGVIFQEVVCAYTSYTYRRYRNFSQQWSDWVLHTGISLYGPIIESSGEDLNNYINSGNYSFKMATPITNLPSNALSGSTNYDLKVFKYSPENVLYQQLTDVRNGRIWTRYRQGDGTWIGWKEVGGKHAPDILFTSPYISKLSFSETRNRKTIQEIAVYNGHIFEFGNEVVSIDGANPIAISCGHGNNAMFGKTLHGDFPYLYCGSWNYNDCKVYVNEVTTSSATLVRTITFENMTGHLNMCVDETNGFIYILLNKSEATSVGDIDFIKASLSDGSIISRTTLPDAMPFMQGMEFHNGLIYALNGDANRNANNHLTIFDTSGNIIQKSEPIPTGEVEGISFDNGKLYIADGSQIWS